MRSQRQRDTRMLRVLRLFIVLLCVATLSVPRVLAAEVATPVATPAEPAVTPGSLLASMDPAVAPGQDFYRYADGKWLDEAVIPPDRASYSVSTEISDRTTQQLLGLLKDLSDSNALPEGSDEWKAVQLFKQGTDYNTRNAQGIAPVEDDLNRINAISNLDELYAFLRYAVLNTHASGLYGVSAGPDLKDSSIYTLWYGGPALGLPNRDYYWKDTADNERVRQAYRDISAKLLSFAGYDE